ncbi:hypothetical protein [Planktotalea sp.]|uniref:hypothetical protein n=1 Tax=Planktotalea sp. TaxID=2029877 RepID=UPI003D6BC912
MVNPRHFLRMATWVRRPPSAKRVKLILVVALICAAIVLIERYFGWPDALTPNTMRLSR